MRRREFVQLTCGALAILFVAHAHAQEFRKKPRIAYLTSPAGVAPSSFDEAFVQGLRALGYHSGENIDYRWVAGTPEQMPTAVADLLASGVDVIITSGGPATNAARQATSQIPIVMISSDPLQHGQVSNLARPGGNLTGRSLLAAEVGTKRLELLKEAVSGLSRVAVMFSAENPAGERDLKLAQETAPALGLEIVPVPVRRNHGFERALAIAADHDAGAAILLSQGQTVSPDANFEAAIVKHRVPTMFTSKSFVARGGLMSYGPDVPEVYRQAAVYVHRILKGANPGDLPVEAPTKFELAINLKTAKAIGLDIPPTLLARADEVIE